MLIFLRLEGKEIRDSAYLFLGSIGPAFENPTLGMGDKLAIKAIAGAYGVSKEEVKKRYEKTGDLGDVAFELNRKGEGDFLTIEDVFSRFKEIEESSGKGSQDEKIRLLSEILQRARPEEGKYILRIALGKMRLGFGDQFLLEAFSIAFAGDREHLRKIKESYSVCTDIGELAQPVENFEELEKRIPGLKAAEEKYDGERVQIHKNGSEIQAFSRRLENITSQYPDLIEAVRKNIRADKIILDGKIIAYIREGKGSTEEFHSFQKLMQRRRKYEVEKYTEILPVAVFFFDVLFLEGKSLLKEPYPEEGLFLKST